MADKSTLPALVNMIYLKILTNKDIFAEMNLDTVVYIIERGCKNGCLGNDGAGKKNEKGRKETKEECIKNAPGWVIHSLPRLHI